jgi:UDP-N-acetylglucosamine--N-acetylmuramyl-(pentapeptide) pyrophosphoryl-undecaprenol N-acetylglucosamine transferase
MRILFTGGGTLGSVTPLLALYEYLVDHSEAGAVRAAWIGTRKGPEWNFIRAYPMIRIPIFTGKIRRYMSIRNLIDPFFLFLGFFQALYHIVRFRPQVVVNAGSYVGVGVIWAAWFLGVRSVALQLDIRPSLANILTLLHVKKIYASCEGAAKKFPKSKTIVTGIPVRKSVQQAYERTRRRSELERAKAQYGIYDTAPVALISGGSTGAEFLNVRAGELARDEERGFHIIHITGERKTGSGAVFNMYHQFSFVDDFAALASIADIALTRAGMGTISELAVLGIPMILVPIPSSHQGENALYCEKNGAAIYVSQERAPLPALREILGNLLRDTDRRSRLAKAAQHLFVLNASERIAEVL